MSPYFTTEPFRAWKLATLAASITLLIVGSYVMPAPDWDIPISIGMAVATYLLAPWSVDVFARRRWLLMPVAAYAACLCIDGIYTAYWAHEDPAALVMRPAQWPASLLMFLACGMVWRHRGDLRSLLRLETGGTR